MYLVDTNIFLEILLARAKSDECIKFLEQIRDGKTKAVVTSFCIHSIEVVLSNFKKTIELKNFLLDLIQFSGINLYSTSLSEEIEILDIMDTQNLDFDDALMFYVCKKLNLKLVSFDTHFDKTDIKRIEPVAIVKKENAKDK